MLQKKNGFIFSLLSKYKWYMLCCTVWMTRKVEILTMPTNPHVRWRKQVVSSTFLCCQFMSVLTVNSLTPQIFWHAGYFNVIKISRVPVCLFPDSPPAVVSNRFKSISSTRESRRQAQHPCKIRSSVHVGKERRESNVKSNRKDQNNAVGLLDELENLEARLSLNFCFWLWEEKHCLELPWKSHGEPKPKLVSPTHSTDPKSPPSRSHKKSSSILCQMRKFPF